MGRKVFVKVIDGGLEPRGQLRSIHMLGQVLETNPRELSISYQVGT